MSGSAKEEGAESHEGEAGEAERRVCPSCGRKNPIDARFCARCAYDFEEGQADPLLGRVIEGRYRIDKLLGRGGMGVVYRVEHVRMHKLMAMKLLHGALARDKYVVRRFEREAEAASKLDHPNTVALFDFGYTQDGMMFLVMEYVTGQDLGLLAREKGPMPFPKVARLAAQIAASVDQAHTRGVIHRDLKPENVMVIERRRRPDFVKVLDFGLAKLRDDTSEGRGRLTRKGSIVGTPYYMAPELIEGQEIDGRADVYALGALMYKLVVGVPPFVASSAVGVLTKHLTEPVIPPTEKSSQRDLPKIVDHILLKCLAKDPNERYASMAELEEELMAYLIAVDQAFDSGSITRSLGSMSGVPVPEIGSGMEIATRKDVDQYEARLRRWSWLRWVAAALFLAGLGLGAYLFYRSHERVVEPVEVEPNNEPAQATPLPLGVPYRGYLGRRSSATRSDADFYLIHNASSERRYAHIEVTGIPNMDLVIELYRVNTEAPLITANSGPIGQSEAVANFPLDGHARYYLRVRERWLSGELPTENVSDPYEVTFRLRDREEGDEGEVNDSIEQAEALAVGGRARGYIGWGGDADVYCFEEGAEGVRLRLEGVETLDLLLKVIDRATLHVQETDEGARGEGETVILEEVLAERTCVEVSAHGPKEGIAADAERPYLLHAERIEAEAGTEANNSN